MDAQLESCETPPGDPQAAGKIRKAFKLFGKGKPASSVASIFTRRGKGEGAPKSPLPRSKTLDGLSESTTAMQDAPEAATVSEPAASTPQHQPEGGSADEAAQDEQPPAEEQKVESSPTRPSISSITSAKSLNFLSLLRRSRRGGGAGGVGGDRQVHTEAHRGGRQRKGLRSLFGSMRWRRRDDEADETDEGAGPPLTASRSNSVEIIKEHLTLTPRPAPRAEGERDLDESTAQSQAPASQPDTPKPGIPKPAAEEKTSSAATTAAGTSQLNPNASVTEPTSDRLSTLLGDISSILSFDSLTGCGDIVADVEAEWAKASSRVGASATKERAEDTDSGEKSLSSSATPSGKLSPAPTTPTPTTVTTAKPLGTPSPVMMPKPVVATPPPAVPPSSPPVAKCASPASPAYPPPASPAPAPAPAPRASVDATSGPLPPSPALSHSPVPASPPITKPEARGIPVLIPVSVPVHVPVPAPTPSPSPPTTAQSTPAVPRPPAAAAAGPKPTPPAAPLPKFTTSQMGGAKQTAMPGKRPPKIVTTFGLSCDRTRTSPPTKPASGPDTKPPTPTAKSAPVSTFSDFTPAAAEPAWTTKGPPMPAAYKPPPSYNTTPFSKPSAFPEPPAAPTYTRPPPVASPVSPLPPPVAVASRPSSTSSPPEEEARVDGGEDLASREGLVVQRETAIQRSGTQPGVQEQQPAPGGGAGAPGARGDKRSPVVKPASLSKIPVSGGGRAPAAVAATRVQQPPSREPHSNGDATAAVASCGPSTPMGSEEDMLHPLSRDTGSRDTLSGYGDQSPATSPPTSPHEFDDDRATTPSPPGASASRRSSKAGSMSGIPLSGIPRDSKIPIKRDTHAAPAYHSLQAKGDAPRTKIPVSKVPVRRGGHTAVRK